MDKQKFSKKWRQKWDAVAKLMELQENDFIGAMQMCEEKMGFEDPWEIDRFAEFYNNSSAKETNSGKKNRNKRRKKKKKQLVSTSETTAGEEKLAGKIGEQNVPVEEKNDEIEFEEDADEVLMKILLSRYKNVENVYRVHTKQ